MAWEKVGRVSVDSGLCWVGDPCYVMHGKSPDVIGKSWDGFCDKLRDAGPENVAVFDTLGIAVTTAHGDGTYPVSVQRDKDGRVVAVKVSFR